MSLALFTGPMFSGKTKRLFEVAKAYEMSQDFDHVPKKVLRYKPSRDTRSVGYLTHDGQVCDAIAVTSLGELWKHLDSTQSVAAITVDEVQFLDLKDSPLLPFLHYCEGGRIDVYAAGLNLKANGTTWDGMNEWFSSALTITVLQGTCRCGAPSVITHKKGGDPSREEEVGDHDIYIPMCLSCWTQANR
jgi:thymidine kinase